VKRLLIRLLVVSCCLVALSYVAVFAGARGGWAPWTLAIGANGVLMSLMAIGAVRRDTLPRSLVWTFSGMFLFCAGCFIAALTLPAAEGANGPLLFGLPLRTAIVLYGIGVVPIFILPFAYALTFESSTLSEGDLNRVRSASAAVRAEREAA
jgi:hypothetical protein